MSDDLDAMIERVAREEQDDADRKHGQHILEAVAAQEDRIQGRAEDPLLELLRQAYRAKAGEGRKL